MQDWILALAASPLVYVGLYILVTIDGFFPPVPSESLVIALAALAMSAGPPNLALVIVIAAAGAFTGDQIAYAIGKRLDVRRLPGMRGPRAQRTLDWAERTLTRRGPVFILAARYIPIGRVAVNMTAGALGYSRRRFVGLTAIAAVTWSFYSVAIGIGAGVWFEGHPLMAVLVGVCGGLVIGLVLDLVLGRVADLRARGAAKAGTPVGGIAPDPIVAPRVTDDA